MNDRVRIEIEPPSAYVRLNRADKHNALDLAMFDAIARSQRVVAADHDTRAVILCGEGVDFCTGLDVKALMKDRGAMRRLLWKWLPWRSNLAQRVSTGWRKLAIPVIAAVHGRCWGGGLQIALGADFRIAHPDSGFSIMESRWGLIPDMGGTLALREIVHRDQACALAMTARVITAEQALSIGLITEIHEQPMERAAELVDELANRSPDAIAAIKKLYDKSWTGGEGMALARETLYQLRVVSGRNQRIAVKRELGEDQPYRRRGKI